MLAPQFVLPIAREITVDLFAGGGGASTGIEQALGRHVDIAVNHDPQAISLHERNHPQTRHFCSDVFEVDPVEVVDGQDVGLMWASPDCKHFSKAKGGKPVSKRVRGLAWVVTKWAKAVRPRVICLENVEEFKDWGPLDANNMPDAAKKGRTFKRWTRSLANLGYSVEHRELRACDYGAPTIRKRLFLVARCDGAPIVWPEPTHSKTGGKGLKKWRAAAECIEWQHPCPSIFERARPLAEATLRRIAHGIQRYVIDNPRPFIVPVTHPRDSRVHSIDDPLRTVTGANRGELATLVKHFDRLIERFSNPGDLVYDPFHGLGTVGVRAIKLGRRAGGSELNGEYFRDQVHYLQAAEREFATPSLFDLEEAEAPDESIDELARRRLDRVFAGGGL